MQAKAKKYILDKISGSVAAYSTRLLKASFIGQNVVEVRRSGDNAISGFKANEITDGTLAAWANANGGDGFVATWYDQSGEDNDAEQATAANQPQIVDSGVVQDIEYDGANDYTETPDDNSLDITDAITVSMWIKVASFPNYSAILTKTGSTEWDDYVGLVLEGNDIRLFVNAWSTNYAEFTNLSTNTWYHIVGTYDKNAESDQIKIYVNDAEGTPDTYSTNISVNNDPLVLGISGDDSSYPFDGKISNAIIFNKALSEAEITQIYNEGH